MTSEPGNRRQSTEPRSGDPFPWADVMALGLGLLRLEPRAFWSMTLPEFTAAARAILPPTREPLGRADLAALMSRFPDQPVSRQS